MDLTLEGKPGTGVYWEDMSLLGKRVVVLADGIWEGRCGWVGGVQPRVGMCHVNLDTGGLAIVATKDVLCLN